MVTWHITCKPHFGDRLLIRVVFSVMAFGFLCRLPRHVFDDNLTEPLTHRKGYARHQHCADGGGVDGRLQAALLHEPARPPPGQDRQARQPERPQGAAAVQVIQVVSKQLLSGRLRELSRIQTLLLLLPSGTSTTSSRKSSCSTTPTTSSATAASATPSLPCASTPCRDDAEKEMIPQADPKAA